MDKETLSNYGWIVICVLVLAVMLALATPFGTFVADGFKATYTGLFDTGDSALDVGLSAVGVTNTLECGHGRKESGDHSQLGCGHFACEDCGCVPASCGVEGHWSGDGMDHTTVVNHTASKYETPHTYACQCTGWVVPEGATYTTQNGTVYAQGEKLPCNYEPSYTDTYTVENHDYKYSYSTSNNGWKVIVLDKTLESYDQILENIYDRPIVDMSWTFENCSNMKQAPAIPNTVTNLYYTFSGCKSLVDASNLIIPSCTTNMTRTFNGCSSLLVAPDMSKATSIVNMESAFNNCSALTTLPAGFAIPASAKNIQYAFYCCFALEGEMTVHANPTEWTKFLRNTKITSIIGDTTMSTNLLRTRSSESTNP